MFTVTSSWLLTPVSVNCCDADGKDLWSRFCSSVHAKTTCTLYVPVVVKLPPVVSANDTWSGPCTKLFSTKLWPSKLPRKPPGAWPSPKSSQRGPMPVKSYENRNRLGRPNSTCFFAMVRVWPPNVSMNGSGWSTGMVVPTLEPAD